MQKVDSSLTDSEKISLSFCIGMVSFMTLAVLFGLLNLRFLLLPVFIVSNLVIVFVFKHKLLSPWNIFKKDKILSALLLLGIIIQGFINFPSGFKYNEGLLFWSSHGHDGLWHVALMEEIKKQFPPQNPVFAGEPLYNYHYLVDVLMGEYARIFPFFNSLDLYFRFFPVAFSFLIGITIFAFMTRWQNNHKIGYFGLFFVYCVGSFGWIVTFLNSGNIFAGETVFWAAQQNTILGNPPHAVSHILLPAFFLSFLMYIKKRTLRWIASAFFIGYILAGIKVSGGLVMLVGLSAAALIDLIFNRKYLAIFLTGFLALSNVITFKAMTSKDAASFLMFLPWWFIRTMVVDKLDWMDMEHRRQHYLSKGTWNATLRVIQLEITAFLIFVAGNLGMRVLGVFEIIKNVIRGKTVKDPLEALLFFSMLTGLIVPLLFVQKGIIYNNIQFMQYFLLIFGFYAAVTAYKIIAFIKNTTIKYLVIAAILSLSLPTVIGNLVEFYGPKTSPLAKVTNGELEALKYLKNNSKADDIILNLPFNKDLNSKFDTQPKPIYAWYSTGYIAALSGRRSFLASEEQVLITGYPLEKRLNEVKNFYNNGDFKWNSDFLKKNKIDFVYISKGEIDKPLNIDYNILEIFFENNDALIYRIKDG